MKKSTILMKLACALCLMLGMGSMQAQQPCTVSITYTVGANGSVSFSGIAAPTNSTTYYYWYLPGSTTPNGPQGYTATTAGATYTANGTYSVTFGIGSSVPMCSVNITQTISVNTVTATPPCSLNILYISSNPSNPCSDSAMVTTTGNWCSPVSYTWSTGATGPSAGGLCQNTTYTVLASAPAGTNCCSSGSLVVSIPSNTVTPCNMTANFTASQAGNGVVNFNNTTTGALPGTSYFWSFGDNTTSFQTNPSHTYLNGTYTVVLIAVSSSVSPTCSSSAVQVISVTSNTNPCNLNAGFTMSQSANGVVNFNNTSTGTSGSVTYTWSFGDNSTSNVTSPVHTYSANGSYVVTLTANNNGSITCVNTVTATVWVNSYCNLAAGFTYSAGANGLVTFNNTTTGTIPPFTAYQWNFGDATTSGQANPSHTYANGTYTVTLTAYNFSTAVSCSNIVSQVITISSNSCNLVAGFTASSVGNNVVNFSNTSTGTTGNTTYNWSFGDGNFASGIPSPTHTYAGSGVYTAVLFVTDSLCSDSIAQTFSVTGTPCVANSNFSLSPSGTPQVWNAAPSFPWNVTGAVWNWGDGSSSNVLYTSHTYSAAGLYTICLTVTVSCNATSSTCTSYSIYRTTQDMSIVQINVVDPGTFTGISANGEAGEAVYTIQPNPSNGNFSLNIKGLKSGTADIAVYNLVGDLIYSGSSEVNNGTLVKDISLSEAASGVYLVKVNSDNKILTKKVIVNKQ